MVSRCPECGIDQIIENNGEMVCLSCGLVLDDSMFEENPFLEEGKQRQAKLPSLTSAGGMKVDGNIVKNSWLYSTREKNLQKAEDMFNRIASKIRVPETITREALRIFKIAVEQGVNVGRDNLSLIYASVYASCLINGLPKTPLELTKYSEVNRKKMMRSYLILKKKLGLKTNVVDPADFIPRFGSKLKLKADTITLAIKIVGKLKNKAVFSGKNPQTIVASALYLASQMNDDYRTQRDIANSTGVIEVTIRKVSKLIAGRL